MGKLTVTTHISLDGVMQAPGGPEEDTSGGFPHGGWTVPHVDEEGSKFIAEVFQRADAFLLGRGTYQIFASYWPRFTDPKDPIASKLNALPKHVASRTLAKTEWNNSTLVHDVVGEVGELKRRYPRELQVWGSAGLLQTLLSEELIDELNLLVFPVVLGTGKRLFGSGTKAAGMATTASRTTGSGVLIATYRREGPPRTGSFMRDG
jgi:dihydrofolate reductase